MTGPVRGPRFAMGRNRALLGECSTARLHPTYVRPAPRTGKSTDTVAGLLGRLLMGSGILSQVTKMFPNGLW